MARSLRQFYVPRGSGRGNNDSSRLQEQLLNGRIPSMEAPNQDYFSSQHSSRGLPISLAPAAAESGEEGSLAEGQAVTGFRENASLRSREFIFLEQEGSLFWQ